MTPTQTAHTDTPLTPRVSNMDKFELENLTYTFDEFYLLNAFPTSSHRRNVCPEHNNRCAGYIESGDTFIVTLETLFSAPALVGRMLQDGIPTCKIGHIYCCNLPADAILDYKDAIFRVRGEWYVSLEQWYNVQGIIPANYIGSARSNTER